MSDISNCPDMGTAELCIAGSVSADGDVIYCPVCGCPNDFGNSVCDSCHTAFAKYWGCDDGQN